MTKAVGGGARGPGLDGRGARQPAARRPDLRRSWRRSPKSKSTSRPASTTIVDYLAVADVGTVMHPNAASAARSTAARIQGIGHVRSQKLVYDPHYGAALVNAACTTTSRRRFSTSRSTRKWAAVEHARSEQPGRRQGHRRTGDRRRRRRRCSARWPTRSATTSSGARRCSRSRSSTALANGRQADVRSRSRRSSKEDTTMPARFAM